VVLISGANGYRLLNVRIAPHRIAETIDFLDATWRQFVPDKPYDQQFLSDRFALFYAEERRLNRSLTLTAGLTVFTACLGIMGLAAFLVRQRVKEVGVRRVLGASESSVFVLLSSDFLRVVALANVIAIPAAWYGLDQWLNDFAYRISLSPSIFVLGAGTCLVFAFAAVAGQAWVAARMNPVDSLRVE
jgi:putative ABC transport system permease protein